MKNLILFRGKNKPNFSRGRNTGNTSPIWIYNIEENSLELSPEVARITSGSFNLSNGREFQNLPTKKSIKHLLPENIDQAQMVCNLSQEKFYFNKPC